MENSTIAAYEFQDFIDEFGVMGALTNLSVYFETLTEPCAVWEKQYFIEEATRLLNAVNKLPTK
jgi:hypothetical protein